MATAKKAAKKVAAPRKSRAKPAVDNLYVISERSRLLLWTPIYWSADYEEAKALRRALEDQSVYGNNGYKMTTVPKIKTATL